MIERPEWRDKVRTARKAIAAETAEGVAMMRRHEGHVFRFAERLFAVVRVVLHENRDRVLDTGWPVIAMGIFVKMAGVLRGALPLAKAGHGRELPIMIRPALEALITLAYIVQKDSALRARRWVEFTFVARRKLLEQNRHLFDGPKNRNLRRRVRDRAKRVQAKFPTDRFWAAGLGCGSLRHMSLLVGMEWYYNTIYWTGSQPTHASAIAVDEHVAVVDRKPVYQMSLSGKGVHREMAALCGLLMRGVIQLNETSTLNLDAIINDLDSEYTAIFRKALGPEEADMYAKQLRAEGRKPS